MHGTATVEGAELAGRELVRPFDRSHEWTQYVLPNDERDPADRPLEVHA